MNEDTTKPSNEGSGKERDIEVKYVNEDALRKLYDARKYADVKGKFVICQPKENIKDKTSESNSNSSSDSNASGSYINVEQPNALGMEQILANECVVISLPTQNNKSKAIRKAKTAMKAKEKAEKEAEEKGEDLDK